MCRMKWIGMLFCCSAVVQAGAVNEGLVLFDSAPAEKWEADVYPIGNGTLGATLYGGVDVARLQFTVDSLWTGNENASGKYSHTPKIPDGDHFGSHQNFGELVFSRPASEFLNYRRELDIASARHTVRWKEGRHLYTREAVASFPDGVVAWRFTTTDPQGIEGVFELKSAHPENETISSAGAQIALDGQLPNKLKYAACIRVLPEGGTVRAKGSGLEVKGCRSVLVLLVADTNYVMDHSKNWMEGNPKQRIEPVLEKAAAKSWDALAKAHEVDHRALFDRLVVDLGTTPDTIRELPLRERIENYRNNAKDRPRPCLDPDLEEMLVQYGRYLLIACSRPGTLPANLQGNWNNKNKPAWFADYHSNINLQMNYWLAESTNLPELAAPLFDLLNSGKPVYAKHTRAEYGDDVPGFVTRMSINPFGGTGWNWNIEGSAWLAQHYWTHYRYGGDREFLETSAYPFLRDVSRFWLGRLKELPDGRLVVPNVWSHEHGPHEDGTAHAQQLMWELFSNTIEAATELNADADLVKQLTEVRQKLVGPKIGSWGQLMEWMEEKPELEKSNHRHTSHLFAVHPGRQISLGKTPELAEAARVSLEKRGEVGDSRRSWTWAWRTGLWARLGQAENAHGCIAGLLAYNTLPNLWTTHAPFQIDGNLGISAGFAEMLVQCQSDTLHLLPALPTCWPTGSVKGLRANKNLIIDLGWKNGTLTDLRLVSPVKQTVELRIADRDQLQTVQLKANQPFVFKK